MIAVAHHQVEPLLNRIGELLSKLPPVKKYEPEPEPVKTIPAARSNDISIKKGNGVYTVEGSWLYKTMQSINFADEDAMRYFDTVLEKTGVMEALRKAGVQEGDTVNIYGLQFDFIE